MTGHIPSPYLDVSALRFSLRPYRPIWENPKITHKGVPKLDCTLKLFVDDEKTKLVTKSNKLWIPVWSPILVHSPRYATQRTTRTIPVATQGLDNLSLIESRREWLTHMRGMMDHGAIPTGSMAHLESENVAGSFGLCEPS